MKLTASVLLVTTIISWAATPALSIRFPDRISGTANGLSDQSLRTAVFALGSFWRSEAAFGCLDGVVRTSAGYAGGSRPNPEYRSQALSVCSCGQAYGKTEPRVTRVDFNEIDFTIEYNPRVISFRELLDVFWTSHDSRQVFGQGPDVGNQYRSIIFTNGTEETRLAALSKEREQTRSKTSVVTTQIQQLGEFYPAEPEHQKFELKRNPFLLQLIGNLPEEELEQSTLATKLNGYAAELCPPRMQRQIDAKIDDIIRKGWPILREI
ncbi:UNVERIFIED_CONTAM: Peptide methionine sulfoxide reductase A5 [Sesamum latifolium]|uniref:peptide-methionine (S)-S-oxide reductase n=1 Tax=Sesamum latifolium TaxID=2727402 RepID=A0AAW2X7F9_9LAMI